MICWGKGGGIVEFFVISPAGAVRVAVVGLCASGITHRITATEAMGACLLDSHDCEKRRGEEM